MKNKTTILIELEIDVTYDVIPGYPQTRDEPGCDADIDDIRYDLKKIERQIDKELEHPDNLTVMLEDAWQDRQEQEGDYLYEQHKERIRGIS